MEVSQTGPGRYEKPILFIFGPSGVGKSYLSQVLEEKCRFLYRQFDTDREERKFESYGFSKEWDTDFQNIVVADLVAYLKGQIEDEHAGVVASFATTYIFTPEMLGEARKIGVTPILLWGTRKHCMESAEKRLQKKGRSFDEKRVTRYQLQNKPTFLKYCGQEYNTFRIDAFRHDGSRPSTEEWIEKIMCHLGG